jgi:hypothetical protein
LQSQQKAVIDNPPDALNLTDRAFTRQRAAKKAHNATAIVEPNNAVDSEPPKWLQQVIQFQMAAAMMGPFGGGGYRAQQPQPELPIPTVTTSNPHTPLRPLGTIPSTPHRVNSVPSVYTPTAVPTGSSPSPTTLKRPADDAYSIIFPDVDVWLSSLDSHPIRGRKKLNYAQFSEGLMAQGILDLGDLISLTADKVLELSGPAMNFGTANRLTMYAREDHMELQSQAKKIRLN